MARHDILYVITSLEVGGTERHLAALSTRLARNGHRVTIYCLFGKGPLAAEPERSGVRVLAPPFASDPATALPRALRLMLAVPQLFGYMLVNRPEISHFFGPTAYLTGGVLGLGAGLGHLVFSRRSLNNYQAKYPLLRTLEHRLHGRMCALLGNSRAVVDQLAGEAGLPLERLGLIHNGIVLQPFDILVNRDAVRAGVNTRSRDLVIAIVANLKPYKGHSDLLRALANLGPALPSHWTLWMIGRDDGIGGDLRRQAEELGLGQNLRFLGERHDVPALLASADIAVSSSHEEGFSNAVLEGMAASRPIVATDAGGNREAVEDGVTGFVVPPRDPAAMASTLLRLIRDPENAVAMGRAGRARVERHFSFEACVSKYETLYDMIKAGVPLSADVIGRIGVGGDRPVT